MMDLLWFVVKQQPRCIFTIDRRAAQTVVGWSAFNASVKESIPHMNRIGYFQPVNEESPTELQAMYTVLKKSQYCAHYLGLTDVDNVFDQVCYVKAIAR